jgi:ABC-type Mn2+/Zn2+ transport system ATPase subunit
MSAEPALDGVRAPAPPSGGALLEALGVVATYGGPPALEDVTFRVAPGERVAVLGPNGGGKSTLFRVVLGDLRPRAGEVRLAGRTASVPQTERSRLDYPVSALDVALMGTLPRLPWWRRPGRAERRDALAALDTVGLRRLAGASFGELSGGQRQRVLVARALVQDARLLLLDEPFSGLDAPSVDALMALLDRLAAEGRGVMVATHDVEQARCWDLVLCLNRRQVAFGPPAATLTRRVLEETYGGAIVTLPGGEAGEARGLLPPHHHDHDHDHLHHHRHDLGADA